MKVIVCGGRDYKDKSFVYSCLDKFHKKSKITLLINGGARGVDQFAYEWAIANGVPSHREFADWDRDGKMAGPIRNQKMRDMNPDCIIAFPGGKGTADMVKRAKGVPVHEYREHKAAD